LTPPRLQLQTPVIQPIASHCTTALSRLTVTLCNPITVNRLLGITRRLPLQNFGWRRLVFRERRLSFDGLHGVIIQTDSDVVILHNDLLQELKSYSLARWYGLTNHLNRCNQCYNSSPRYNIFGIEGSNDFEHILPHPDRSGSLQREKWSEMVVGEEWRR
jgi:hypothetical protein